MMMFDRMALREAGNLVQVGGMVSLRPWRAASSTLNAAICDARLSSCGLCVSSLQVSFDNMLHAGWQVLQALLQKDWIDKRVIKGVEGKPAQIKGDRLVGIDASILSGCKRFAGIIHFWIIIEVDLIIEADFVIRDAISLIGEEVLNHPEQAHHL